MHNYSEQAAIALGLVDNHICWFDHIGLHSKVVEPWKHLTIAAKAAGFDLAIASGFRGFERQQHIWDAKMRGDRPVLDDQSCAVDISLLSPLEKVKRIMRWSALPGASRHHWGTDIDIYDRAAVPKDYNLQLIAEEYTGKGPFAPMSAWLVDYLQQGHTPHFILPYRDDNNGVMPELWHLSYQPVAEQYQKVWTLDILQNHLLQSAVLGKEAVLSSIDELYEQFIKDSINPIAVNV